MSDTVLKTLLSICLLLQAYQLYSLGKHADKTEDRLDEVEDWIEKTIVWMNNESRKTIRNKRAIEKFTGEKVEEIENEEHNDRPE